MKFYCDGSGWNGESASICVVDADGKKFIKSFKDDSLTNNSVEYMAVIKACEMASDEDIVYTDSLLVVQQAAGQWRCKPRHLRILNRQLKALIKEKSIDLNWISRDNNPAGKLLEKKPIIDTED